MTTQSIPLTAGLGTAQKLAWALALGFLAAGILGFVPNPILGPEALFVTNTAHNLVHVVSAIALIIAASIGDRAAANFMTGFGITYLGVGVLGFVVLGGEPLGYLLGVIHFNALDNWLHLGLGAAILASGIAGARRG